MSHAASMEPAQSVVGDEDEAASPAVAERREASGGNLFLTCLRLRFQERGSWTKALTRPDEDDDVMQEQSSELQRRDLEPVGGTSAAGSASTSPSACSSPSRPPGATRRLLRRFLARHDEQATDGYGSPSGSPARCSRRLSWLCPLAFGAASDGLQLEPSAEGKLFSRRRIDTVRLAHTGQRGVAMTSGFLRKCASTSSSLGFPAATCAYYFEIEVLETSTGATSTLSLGFAWPELSNMELEPQALVHLPHSFAMGGELPKAHFGGVELDRPIAWRPILHLRPGSVCGALLETWPDSDALAAQLRLSIFQDGVVQTEAFVAGAQVSSLSEAAACTLAAATNGLPPHGLVEITGSVVAVRLRTNVTYPPQ